MCCVTLVLVTVRGSEKVVNIYTLLLVGNDVGHVGRGLIITKIITT